MSASEYLLVSKLFGHAAFFQNSGTLDQLKNSGGLRLIRQRNVVDSIESYDQQVKRMALRDIYETNFFVDVNKVSQNLFDSRGLLKIYVDTANYKKPITPFETIKLNEQYLNDFLNSIRTLQLTVKQNQDLQVTIKDKATLLIDLIKKEYHLE